LTVEEVEHRADALFALPRIPRTVTLLGELPGWRRDVADRRIEEVDSAADAVVAAGERVQEALRRAGAGAVVVDGPRAAGVALKADARYTRRLLPIPVSGSPIVYADLGWRRAARYGIERVVVHPDRWRTLRNRVAGLAILAGLPVPAARLVTLGVREQRPPALLSGARELGIAPGPWVMVVSKGSIVRRNAVFVFPRHGNVPEYVLKFSRVPGMTEAFDREQRGFELATAAGRTVTAHATRYLGRFHVDGYHASVESAAVGTKLVTLLRRPGSRAAKLAVLERVVRWLIDVARDTATPPEGLGEQRDHYAREVVPFWVSEGAAPELVERLPPIPAAFQHNDMAEENLVIDDDGFRALDWEWANPRGLPLGDLVYFGVHALRLVDGVTSDEPAERDAHFAALLAGDAPSSPVMFRWIGEAVAALGLPPESLGPMVTLSWLERGRISRVERWRAEKVGGAPLGLPFGERAAKLWLEHPALGAEWDAWRR
jgi:hypothetical protein